MNSTIKILLAFLFKLLLITTCIAGTFYIDGKILERKNQVVNHISADATPIVITAVPGEPVSAEAKSSLDDCDVENEGQIRNRLYIEIIL